MEKNKKKRDKTFAKTLILITAVWISFFTGGCANGHTISSGQKDGGAVSAASGQPKVDESALERPSEVDEGTLERQSEVDEGALEGQPEVGESPSAEDDSYIPYGFNAASLQLYKSGALDSFIPSGSAVDQCVIADLDMDGVDDVLLTISMPDTAEQYDTQSYGLNTLILKGRRGRGFQLAAENRNANDERRYDGSAFVTAGDGWFKLTRSRGTCGGYVHSQLFQYDIEKKDWFLTADYANQYGYTLQGETVLQTPKNFGSITFENYNMLDQGLYGRTKNAEENEKLSVNDDGFKISVGGSYYITLQDKEKESKINGLITEQIKLMIAKFRELGVNTDLSISGTKTYETPRVISIEYSISGTIGGNKLNFIGDTAAMFDIEQGRQIRLSDIIDVNKLYEAIKQKGSFYPDPKMKKTFMNMSKDRCLKLLKTSDDLNASFESENTGIYSTVYERSLHIYFQPEFIGRSPDGGSSEIYIPIEDILSDVKLNYWDLPEEETTRIEWKG